MDTCSLSRPDAGRVRDAYSLTLASNTSPEQLQAERTLRPRAKIDYKEYCSFFNSKFRDSSQSDNLFDSTDLHAHNENFPSLNNPYYHSCFHIHAAAILVPNTFNQALASNEFNNWIAAMDEEILSLHENNTWELVKRPPNAHIIGGRWLYKLKCDPSKSLRYKARYVAQGFTQILGLNYQETYAPTARMTSVKILMQILFNMT